MSEETTGTDRSIEDKRHAPKAPPFMDRGMRFISAVRFGVVLLCILVALSVIGMLIIQQNVSGFDAYYAGLTPAEKLVFGSLGLFDIYKSWYYNFILLILSLNLVLASIDRFPSAWSYISKPKKWGTRKWLEARSQSTVIRITADSLDSAKEKISAAMKKRGLTASVVEMNGDSYVFGESGKWNRLGAYIVHVTLLTLFLGHFVALQTGFDADVAFQPGDQKKEIEMIEFNLDKQNRYSVGLPFTITCTDIQQKLIDPNGPIEVFNTLDWATKIRIDDPEYGSTEANVSLNNPFTYRGYRFFQAQTVPTGNARTITLELTPESEGAKPFQIVIKRIGSTTLNDGSVVKYDEFLPDFAFNNEGKPDTQSADYNNPAALLSVTPKGGQKVRVFAFAGNFADDLPVGAPKAGYKWRLKSFEKAPRAHILSIKYDPYSGAFIAWYFGGIGLMGALVFVFFFSHRRVWALVTSDGADYEVVLAGEANRNHQGFEDRFKKLAGDLGGEPAESVKEDN